MFNIAVYDTDSGVDFVLPASQKDVTAKKKLTSNRGDRVPKLCFNRRKANQKHSSFSRKASGNETTNQRRFSNSRRTYFGVFRQWVSKSQNPAGTKGSEWEKGTASILKNDYNSDTINKTLATSVQCLNMHTFDLNKLLPAINSSFQLY